MCKTVRVHVHVDWKLGQKPQLYEFAKSSMWLPYCDNCVCESDVEGVG